MDFDRDCNASMHSLTLNGEALVALVEEVTAQHWLLASAREALEDAPDNVDEDDVTQLIVSLKELETEENRLMVSKLESVIEARRQVSSLPLPTPCSSLLHPTPCSLPFPNPCSLPFPNPCSSPS